MKNTANLSNDEMFEELSSYIKKSSSLTSKERNRVERIIERIKAYFNYFDEKMEKYYLVDDKISLIAETSDHLYQILNGDNSVKPQGLTLESIKGNISAIVNASDELRKFFYDQKVERQKGGTSNESTEDNLIVSYLDSPSKASLMDLSRRQFTLLKVRYGAVDSFLVDVAQNVLERVDEVEREIKGAPNEQIELMLRGIWFDDKNDTLEIHLDLLHSDSETIFKANEIAKKFQSEYEGRTAKITINVKFTIMFSDSFSPISDDYYIDVKKSLYW